MYVVDAHLNIQWQNEELEYTINFESSTTIELVQNNVTFIMKRYYTFQYTIFQVYTGGFAQFQLISQRYPLTYIVSTFRYLTNHIK